MFERDDNKAAENERKHNVTFDEAESAFDDENSVEFFDAAHSTEEKRFQRLAISTKRLLFIIYTIRDEAGEEVIRLISARKATARETEIYNEYND